MNMVKQNKIDMNQYCQGCLTNDRRLVSIDDKLHIFQKLMDGDIKSVKNLSKTSQMCFECRARLHATEKFIQRAKKAQEFLTNAGKMVQLKCLSDLTIVNQYVLEFNDVKIDTDIIKTESNNKLADEDIDIKLEDIDDDKVIYDSEKEEYNVKEESIKKTDIDIKENVKEESINKKDIDIKESIKQKKLRAMKARCEIVYLKKELNKHKFIREVKIDDSEAFYWLRERKRLKNYRFLKFKCDLCITGYSTKIKYDEHINKFHLKEKGNYECNICKKIFKYKDSITKHIKDHYRKYVCLICNYENNIKSTINYHIDYAHGRVVKCLICGLTLVKLSDFYKHYITMHTLVICDYCGKKLSNKDRLIQHIRLRHYEHRCDICNRTYSSLNSLNTHNKFRHEVTPSEECYCVECDKQFDNTTRYNDHLKTSVKHKTRIGIPCPECNKVYQKRHYMNNHYNFVHLKKTSHYCEKCSRYFVNGFSLRTHIANVHNKIRPVKNKICTICGQGFSTRRILDNHIRTHTGERPFQCDLCNSKFAQKTALVYHRRSIHKMTK